MVALLATALLSGCGEEAAVNASLQAAAAPAPPSTAPPRTGPRFPGPVAVAAAPGATTGTVIGPRPAAPGTLARAEVPEALQDLAVDVAFGGLDLGPDVAGGRSVVYPSLRLTAAADGTTVAHLKLARFRCTTGTAPQPASRDACRRRTVEFADADRRTTRWSLDQDGVLTVDVEGAGYRYGTAVDPDPRLEPRATGRRVRLHAVVQPGEVVGRDARSQTWRPLAEVSGVVDGTSKATGTARQDDGYRNSYRAVLRAH